MDAYPEAQIVLTTRPVEPWLASMERTFYAILSWKRWRVLELIDPVLITPPPLGSISVHLSICPLVSPADRGSY